MSASQTPTIDLYFEDVVIGAELTTPKHHISQDDITKFADATLDHHPLHTDPEYCKTTEFGRPIAHGLYGLSLMEGLKTKTKMYEHTSIASLGWNNVRFRMPLFVEDEVYAKVIFTDKRLSKKSGNGIVTEQVLLINQNGDVVTDAEHVTMVMTRS